MIVKEHVYEAPKELLALLNAWYASKGRAFTYYGYCSLLTKQAG